MITTRELPQEPTGRTVRIMRLESEGLVLIGAYQDSDGTWWGKFEAPAPGPATVH